MKIEKIQNLDALSTLNFDNKEVLKDYSSIDNRDWNIQSAKLSEKRSRIIVQDSNGIYEIESKIAESTMNHVLLSPEVRIPKKSILSVELISA